MSTENPHKLTASVNQIAFNHDRELRHVEIIIFDHYESHHYTYRLTDHKIDSFNRAIDYTHLEICQNLYLRTKAHLLETKFTPPFLEFTKKSMK
jgi:hypothetical protein